MAGPPPKPAPVTPFWSAEDLAQINEFNTGYATQLANLNFNLGDLETDTKYQKTQTNTAAKQNTSNTADEMAARGLFMSSIKDAAVYDIEAQRVLSTKFLDDKLTSARLNAGTQKRILGNSKEAFDKAMAGREVENAQSVNDVNSAAWAEAMANYKPPAQRPAPQPGRLPGVPPKGVIRPTKPKRPTNTSIQSIWNPGGRRPTAATPKPRIARPRGGGYGSG